MSIDYKIRQRKQLEPYFRCLSSSCFFGGTGNYYVTYEVKSDDLLLRRRQHHQILKKWELKKAEDAVSSIQTLLNPDTYLPYRILHARLFALSEEARARYMESKRENDPEFKKLEVVNTCLYQLPSGNVSGYGAAWAIALSRVAFTEKWIGAQELWDYRLAAARMAQQSYGSWEEFFVGYSAGLYYFESKSIQKYMFHNAMFSLMSGSSFLYKKIKWDMNLDPE
ncbi:DUF1266 domain-containing protein [Paenibacillus sp. CN-4]|uniref:DUF1266 domain-containing protein n=1 Tax=Paenibacillus nanchangensis TaxID=3348343 RepID=UPI00397C1AA4